MVSLMLSTGTFAAGADRELEPQESATTYPPQSPSAPPAPADTPSPKLDPNQVVGRVEGHTLRLADMLEQMGKLPPQARGNLTPEKLYPLLLQQMATRAALVKRAREKGEGASYPGEGSI